MPLSHVCAHKYSVAHNSLSLSHTLRNQYTPVISIIESWLLRFLYPFNYFEVGRVTMIEGRSLFKIPGCIFHSGLLLQQVYRRLTYFQVFKWSSLSLSAELRLKEKIINSYHWANERSSMVNKEGMVHEWFWFDTQHCIWSSEHQARSKPRSTIRCGLNIITSC